MTQKKTRCSWVIPLDTLYEKYHDEEWGLPVYDDNKLFELLTLEGAQSGLSWITILRKRESYRKAFAYFDPKIVAGYSEEDIQTLLQNESIVRHKGKIASTINNARAFIKLQERYGSFSSFLWGYVNNKPITNKFKNLSEVPTQTDLSLQISKDLKKMGFSFVGPTTIYSFMQAAGLVNDHLTTCFCHKGEPWYVYIIRSDDDKLYTGIAKNVERRLKQHQKGEKGAKFFRTCRALKVEHIETYLTHSEALKRECHIKKMSKQDKENLIKTNRT